MIPPESTSVHSLLTKGFALLGLHLSPTSSPALNRPLVCSYYKNPDGSIRWLWPQAADRPDFLRFYHAGRWPARLFAGVVRGLFRLGGAKLVAHGQLTFYTDARGEALLRHYRVARWTVCTGTVGPNRKLVCWYETTGGSRYLLKLALSGRAADNLMREAIALSDVPRYESAVGSSVVQRPRLQHYAPGLLVQQDIDRVNARAAGQVNALPTQALQSLLSGPWRQQVFDDTNLFYTTRQYITELQHTHDDRLPLSLLRKIEWLFNSFLPTETIWVAPAHGDFTPWNTFVRNQTLYLIDWELAQPDLPALYDLFHYIYQANAHTDKRAYKAVRRDIDALLNQPAWQRFISEHNIDVAQAERLYLLHTVSYYLSVWRQQPRWHAQVQWLLTTWNDALTDRLHRLQGQPDRQLVLHDLAFFLHTRPHAAQRFFYDALTDLPDTVPLDLCLPRPVANEAQRYLAQHPLVRSSRSQGRSSTRAIRLRLTDGSQLAVALTWAFKRRSLVFMNADVVWQQARPAAHGLRRPRPEHEAAYIALFYALNGSPIPEQYQSRVAAISPQQWARLLRDGVLPVLPPTGPAQAPAATQTGLLAALQRTKPNRGWRGWLNRLTYALETVRSLMNRNRRTSTFNGVDGAGQSTVIAQTRHALGETDQQRVIV